ncbi:hypothetical protein BpHYR1_010412 [Brachionus plicatilis]|uniref:Uncharacterized protein n=1 Tax=Brachionus plicatilis TaxID=10195 RepID=A0A3M7T2H7_BRAPC|nr:hypothetical protein BpHYR1_010412 [Brachionus plicatilis]
MNHVTRTDSCASPSQIERLRTFSAFHSWWLTNVMSKFAFIFIFCQFFFLKKLVLGAFEMRFFCLNRHVTYPVILAKMQQQISERN